MRDDYRDMLSFKICNWQKSSNVTESSQETDNSGCFTICVSLIPIISAVLVKEVAIFNV